MQMHRFETGQNHYLTAVVLLSLMILINFGEALAQKIDLETLEIEQGINPANRSVSIFAEINPMTIFQGGQLTLRIIGRIDRGHHLYSVRQQGEFAPDSTKIVIADSFLTATSEMDESITSLIYDEAFETPLQVHKDDFWITRKYHLSRKVKSGSYQLSGYLTYQICTNKICSLPLKNYFSKIITIKKPVTK